MIIVTTHSWLGILLNQSIAAFNQPTKTVASGGRAWRGVCAQRCGSLATFVPSRLPLNLFERKAHPTKITFRLTSPQPIVYVRFMPGARVNWGGKKSRAN